MSPDVVASDKGDGMEMCMKFIYYVCIVYMNGCCEWTKWIVMGKSNAQPERMSKYIYPYNPHTVPLNIQGPMHPEDKQKLLKEVKLKPPSTQITTLSRTRTRTYRPSSWQLPILDWSFLPNMGRWGLAIHLFWGCTLALYTFGHFWCELAVCL